MRRRSLQWDRQPLYDLFNITSYYFFTMYLIMNQYGGWSNKRSTHIAETYMKIATGQNIECVLIISSAKGVAGSCPPQSVLAGQGMSARVIEGESS